MWASGRPYRPFLKPAGGRPFYRARRGASGENPYTTIHYRRLVCSRFGRSRRAVTPSHQLHFHGTILPAKAALTGMVDTVRDLRPYLVQVLDAWGEQVEGTGFHCDAGGYVLTCWHVVQKWPERDMKGEVRWKGQLVHAELILEHSVPEADLAVLKLEASDDFPADGLCPHLPLDVHERLQLKDELRSFGYPMGQFSEGISIRGKIGGLETTRINGLDILPIAGINLDNIDHGFSGAPVINERTQKVIGLVHAKQHASQAFIVPLSPLFSSWPQLRVAHDVFEHIRQQLADQARQGLEGKLHTADFIPLRLEAGRVKKKSPGGRDAADAKDPADLRKWENFDPSGLLPPQGRYLLSADVGSGKTTFVQWLAAELVRSTDFVPIVMHCTTLEGVPPRNLQDLLAEAIRPLEAKFQAEDLKDWRRQAVVSNRLVFLFDGLDQIQSGLSSDMAKRVFSLIGNNPVLITSRPSAVIALEREFDPELIFLRLQPFSVTDQRTYFGEHYAVVREACAQTPDLAKVPMLAFMMRELAVDGIRAEQPSRTELYGQFLNHVLTKHESNVPLLDKPGLLTHVRHGLGKLAYESLARPKPCTQRVPIEPSNSLADTGATESGLIAFGLVNRILDIGGEALLFIHQSFQEYLAALYAHERHMEADCKEAMATIINERWHPKWAEVIAFLSGLKGEQVVQEILAVRDNVIHSNLFLAARCAAEVIDIEPAPIENIKKRLLLLNQRVFQNDTLKALGQLRRWADVSAINFIVERLCDEDAVVRKTALEVLKDVLADHDDKKAMRAIVLRLSDEEQSVRLEALEALENLVERVDGAALRAIVERLNDKDPSVSKRALEALAVMAEHVDEAFVPAIVLRLHDKDSSVRSGALLVLQKLAVGVREEAVHAIVLRLSDKEASERVKALDAFAMMAEHIDEAAVRAIVLRLQDEDSSVRSRALLLLQKLAFRVDEPAVRSIVLRLSDKETTVRVRPMEAMEALVGMSDRLDEKAVGAIIERLHDDDNDVRMNMIKVLKLLVERVDKVDLRNNVALLSDKEPSVRVKALNVLRVLSDHLDESDVCAIVERLHDLDSYVRAKVLEALAVMPDRLEETAVRTIVARLRDEDGLVRRRAQELLNVLGDRVDREALRLSDEAAAHANLELLSDESMNVRRMALRAMRVQADRLDETAIPTIVAQLSKENLADVRYEAFNLLSVIADRVDERAVPAIFEQLNDDSPYMRTEALTLLTKMAGPLDQVTLRAMIERLNRTSEWEYQKGMLAMRRLADRLDEGSVCAIATGLLDGPYKIYDARSLLEVLDDRLYQVGLRTIVERLSDMDSFSNERKVLTALEALKLLVNRADEEAVRAIVARLSDKNSTVRYWSLELLSHGPERVDKSDWQPVVARLCDRAAVRSIVARLRDEDIRNEDFSSSCWALDVLSMLGDRVDKVAMRVIVARMRKKGSYSYVRSRALVALKKLAERVDKPTVRAIVAQLSDQDVFVRVRALEALEVLADRVDKAAIHGIVKRLRDEERCVENLALEVLKQRYSSGLMIPLLKDHSKLGIRQQIALFSRSAILAISQGWLKSGVSCS